jgi:hypothetical protein
VWPSLRGNLGLRQAQAVIRIQTMTDGDFSARLAERAEKAAVAPRQQLEAFFKETAKEVLVAFARNPHLQERDLLRLLERKDLPAEVLREIAGHKETARNYRVRLALVRHPKTPRLISLPILKFLYLFDLVRVCQTPAVPTDVKLVAEETILKKVETIPRGEKINLARRSSGRVAAGLLVTEDRELITAALDNPLLSEAHVLRVLALENLPTLVVESIAHHEKWSHRYHLRLALIRNPRTPLRLVLAFLPDMAVSDLRDICLDRRMPEQVRHYVLAHCAERLNKKPPPITPT